MVGLPEQLPFLVGGRSRNTWVPRSKLNQRAHFGTKCVFIHFSQQRVSSPSIIDAANVLKFQSSDTNLGLPSSTSTSDLRLHM